MSEEADERLIEALRRGDENAFALIYDRFCQRLYRTSLALCSSAADAEDAVHDTFAGLWASRTRIGRLDDLTAYLFASLRHAASRQRNRNKRQTSVLEGLREWMERKAVPTSQRTTTSDLEELLRGLPLQQREVIVMKIYGGLTFAETARALNVSANTAASRYRYGLEKLRLMLEREENHT
jgi:RNA polymerase sigma-70 factor, ECF subfamily